MPAFDIGEILRRERDAAYQKGLAEGDSRIKWRKEHDEMILSLTAECARLKEELATAKEVHAREVNQWSAHVEEIASLKALLREWRETQFFDTATAWQVWVSDFGPRVDAALGAP